MNVQIKHIKGVTFIGKGDTNHWVSVDGPEEFQGSNAGTRPKELLLISLGTCTGSDVATILRKKQVPLQDMELEVRGDVVETHPKVFSKIHIIYKFFGTNLSDKDLKRAIELSQNKYCPIAAMLSKACEITYSYQINPSKVESE